MATTTTMSGAEFDRLPLEEGRYLELLDGEVIEVGHPTPKHQLIPMVFMFSLRQYFRREPGGALPDSEFALAPNTRLCPDVAILLQERWAALDQDRSPIPLPPDIAIEIISPSERSAYSERKVWKYLETGVQELWQVMPAVSRVMIFRPGATIADVPHIDDTLTTSLLPGWELPLREIFSV